MAFKRMAAIILVFVAMGVRSGWAGPPEEKKVEPTRAMPRLPLAEGLPADAGECALEKYVKFDDGAFEWHVGSTLQAEGATVYNLRLTSQRWRSAGEVDRTLWKHWVTVAVPTKIRQRMAILVIGGGRHREEPPASVPADMLLLVRAAGAVVVYVDNIPNQPLELEKDGKQRVEDNLVARSWVLAMRDDDASWLVRFPMVKSAVKAMDAAEQFLKGLAAEPGGPGEDVRPDGFFVAGASKRGWTTWLTAAVDPRVKGIAPMVIDVLNMQAHTPHHWRSYGFWAPALKDYESNGIPAKFGTPELARVIAQEDPLAYLARVKDIPKYIVTATGDEFFPTDSFRHYEDKIPGVWRVRSVPNTGHSLRNTTAPLEVLSFYRMVATGKPLPEMTWKCEPGWKDGGPDTLRVRTSIKPAAVTLWQATNPKARDFRFSEIKNAWDPTILSPASADGREYIAHVPKPESGWRAYMVECRFDGADGPGNSLVFTTRVFITPDTLPFELPRPAK